MNRLFHFLLSFLLLVPFVFANPIAATENAVDIEKRGSTGDFTGDFTGEATWSYQGLGACGIVTENTDFTVGVQAEFFDKGFHGTNPNDNPICGRTITARYKGKTVTAKITDRNGGGNKYDLNFSPAAFKKLAPLTHGRIFHVHWVLNPHH